MVGKQTYDQLWSFYIASQHLGEQYVSISYFCQIYPFVATSTSIRFTVTSLINSLSADNFDDGRTMGEDGGDQYPAEDASSCLFWIDTPSHKQI